MNYTKEIFKILVKKQFREMGSIKEAYKEPIDNIKLLIDKMVRESISNADICGGCGHDTMQELHKLLSKADTLIGGVK